MGAAAASLAAKGSPAREAALAEKLSDGDAPQEVLPESTWEINISDTEL